MLVVLLLPLPLLQLILLFFLEFLVILEELVGKALGPGIEVLC